MGNRVTQLPVEYVVHETGAPVWVTELVVEAILLPDLPARLSSMAVEAGYGWLNVARVSQLVVEMGMTLPTGNTAQLAETPTESVGAVGARSTVVALADYGDSIAATALPPGPRTPTGPRVTRITDPTRWQWGGNSALLECFVVGEGLQPRFAPICPSAARPYFSGYMSFWLLQGQARVELVATDGITTWVYPDGTNGKAFSAQRGAWVQLGVAGIDLRAVGATHATLRLLQDTATPLIVYVDAAQLTQTAGQEPFQEGSGGTLLWQEANRELRDGRTPTRRYGLEVVDLSRLDSVTWPADHFVHGGTVRLHHRDFGIDVQQRIIERHVDLLVDGATRLVIDRTRPTLAERLAAPRKAARVQSFAEVEQRPTVEATFRDDAATPGNQRVLLTGRPAGVSIYYNLSRKGDQVPVPGDTDPSRDPHYVLYTGEFSVPQSENDDLQLAAYAQLGNLLSKVLVQPVPRNTGASATLTLAHTGSGLVIAAIAPDQDLVEWAIYARQDAWPTVDGTPNGILQQNDFIARLSIAPDGGGADAQGNRIVGGASKALPATYANRSTVYVIIVPYSAAGLPGPRVTRQLVVEYVAASQTPGSNPMPPTPVVGVPPSGPVSAALTTFTVTAPAVGTCGGQAVTVAWTCNSQVTAGMVLRVYRDGAQVHQQSNPLSPLSVIDSVHEACSTRSTLTRLTRTFLYSWVLYSGAAPIASGSAAPVTIEFDLRV